jgi:hypothetical protein
VPETSRLRAVVSASTVALSASKATVGCDAVRSFASVTRPIEKAAPKMISGTSRNRMKLRE